MAPGKFLVGLWACPWVALIDKVKKQVVKIPCPNSDENQCTDLKPLPGFDLKCFPFYIIRNSKGLNLVDLVRLKMYKLLNKPNQSGSFEKMCIEEIDDNRLRIVFVTRFKASIEEIIIDEIFLNELRALA